MINGKKLRVIISGICYPLWMGRYFWNALERRDDIDLFVVGPFTGNYIPWNNGMNIDYKYVKKPNLALSHSSIGIDVPTRFIEQQLPWQPDLWLSIDAGWRCVGHPSTGKFVQIQTDPHVLKKQYNAVKSQYDHVFCMQGPYLEEGEIYLPYAYDPTIHYPMPEVEKEYDVCLIGLHYQQRDALVSRLRQEGISVHYSIGEVYDDYRIAYNKSRVAISWSSLQDLPARVWEYMGMQLPVVTNRVPDLNKFFIEDRDYLGFSNVDEAVSEVKWLLDNPVQKVVLAYSGYGFVKSETWDKRIEQILETVK